MMWNPPDRAKAVHDLGALLAALRDSLVARSDEAVRVFEERALALDLLGHAYLTRKMVCGDINYENAATLGFSRVEIQFAGLLFRNSSYQVRVLKAARVRDPHDPGHLARTTPVPSSRRRVEFYEQHEFVFLNGLWFPEQTEVANVIVLWDIDDSYQLRHLDLACPKTGGRSRKDVAHWWFVPDVVDVYSRESIVAASDDRRLLEDLEPASGLEQTGTDGIAGLR